MQIKEKGQKDRCGKFPRQGSMDPLLPIPKCEIMKNSDKNHETPGDHKGPSTIFLGLNYLPISKISHF